MHATFPQLSQGADVWHVGKKGDYPLDLALKHWDLCHKILLSVPEEKRTEYVSKKRKVPLLLSALEKVRHGLSQHFEVTKMPYFIILGKLPVGTGALKFRPQV